MRSFLDALNIGNLFGLRCLIVENMSYLNILFRLRRSVAENI